MPVVAWDVVPYQVFDRPFNAGVVAFHESGCKVEFTVLADGTKVPAASKTVPAPTLNEQTKVWEYWIALDPKTLPDGEVELRAKVVPLGEEMITRELEPLVLYANGGGSLKFRRPVWVDGDRGDDVNDATEAKPLQTLKAAVRKVPDGGTVYLKPGKAYSPDRLEGGLKRKYWTIITAAPGVNRDDVEIGPGRPGTDKLCFRNVSLYSDPPDRRYNTILAGEQGKSIVWLDNCRLYNRKGRWGGGGEAFGNRYIGYVTGGLTTEMDNGPGALLMRDHCMVKMTSDAFTGVHTAINCSVEDIDPGNTGAHPDFHQSYVGDKTKYNHVILYNCWGKHCISQGFFGHNLQDSAFVNCLFEKYNTVMYSQYSGSLDHVLFIHISLPNQTWLWREGLTTRNCFMIDCLIAQMGVVKTADVSGLVFESNHFLKVESKRGGNAAAGEAEFLDVEHSDYHLKPSSPAARGGKVLQCVPADMDGRPYDPANPTRGCYQASGAQK